MKLVWISKQQKEKEVNYENGLEQLVTHFNNSLHSYENM